MAEFNLGKVVGEDGRSIQGDTGASVWIKYNSLPQDDGASDSWSEGMDYIGIQVLATTTKPTTGYIWSLFIRGGTPYDGLDSTEAGVPLSANMGRQLQTNITSSSNLLQSNIDKKVDGLYHMSFGIRLNGSYLTEIGIYSTRKPILNTSWYEVMEFLKELYTPLEITEPYLSMPLLSSDMFAAYYRDEEPNYNVIVVTVGQQYYELYQDDDAIMITHMGIVDLWNGTTDVVYNETNNGNIAGYIPTRWQQKSNNK